MLMCWLLGGGAGHVDSQRALRWYGKQKETRGVMLYTSQIPLIGFVRVSVQRSRAGSWFVRRPICCAGCSTQLDQSTVPLPMTLMVHLGRTHDGRPPARLGPAAWLEVGQSRREDSRGFCSAGLNLLAFCLACRAAFS
jgi:hypothetical protein